MTINKNEPRHGFGGGVTGFLGLFIIASKCVYLLRANATHGEFLLGLTPELLIALTCLGAYLVVSHWSRPWARRTAKLLVMLVTLALAIFTMVAAVGYWKTGSIPRLQQFQGLTWNIVAPSVIEMLHKSLHGLVAAVFAVLLLIWLARIAVRRVHWRKALPYYLFVMAVVVLTLATSAIFGHAGGANKYMEVIAARFFRTDIDLESATTPEARQAEARFFKSYHAQLSEKLGPRYPNIFSSLKGSNVIYVVLESTRAKDVPLYGGPADMPNLMQARQHMILLQNLYSQDPRSTKAYAEMDMGRFSLLSWDSYSNNIPWMFPQDGLASHLDKLGYRTFSFVDADQFYDHNMSFQQHHGYQVLSYRQGLNPGSPNADDMKLLARVKQTLAQVNGPFYMMVWPIETHHPYGREYWAHENDWMNSHPEGIKHRGAADHARYLQALHEVDDWFGQLIQVLKDEGKYENTVIVVTGDHGEAFGEHEPGNVFHGNGVYQESVHVTGFIYSPKIDGFREDDRYLRLVDMPATILNLASGDQYLLDDGRSIFDNYAHAVPVYLFNSWAGAAGIIYDGYKLWHREAPGSPVYFASMADIHEDPSKELQVASGERATKLLGMLNTWEAAMKTRTVELLTQKDEEQAPLDDVVRVYCDDGNGFRESLKYSSDFVGLSETVTIPVDHACRALRIAPIMDTKIPKGKILDINIGSLEVNGDQKVWSASDLKLDGMGNGLTAIDGTHFSTTQGSAFLDYSMGQGLFHIKSVSMKMNFVWRKLESP